MNKSIQATADIAVLGMAVMGKNLALNMADHGYQVAIYNRSVNKAIEAAEENPAQNLLVAETLEELVQHLIKPRRLFLMVKAGKAVDDLIEQLLPLLDEGDILMDGGNSHFADSQRRRVELQEKGILFLGVGVSGGESGARNGPAIMPGGSKEAYEIVAPILEGIAAKAADGEPCCAYMGEGGAGHYVKMVHNGIEYADMEIIVELYSYFKKLGYSNAKIADIFTKWNQGELSSYLSEITVKILLEKNPEDIESERVEDIEGLSMDESVRSFGQMEDSPYLLDWILDISEQKGTGRWTNEEGLALAEDISVLSAGLNARYMSMQKIVRVKAHSQLPESPTESAELELDSIANAFLLARLIAYTQGFSLYRAADRAYAWNLQYRDIAKTFREGCIIRSKLLQPIMEAYALDADLENLLLSPVFTETIAKSVADLRKFLMHGIGLALPIPAFTAAISYYDQLRTARGSASLIQAQRDYFGAHTYQRTDREGVYHHAWPLDE